MFSLIFFGVVAFILIVGIVVTSIRKKSRRLPQTTNDTETDRSLSGDADLRTRSRNTVNEGMTNNPGRVVPASNEGLPPDSNDDANETNATDAPANRPVV